MRAGGQLFVEVRQYIPSLKQYGRGVTVPNTQDVVHGIINGATQASDERQ